MTTLSCDGSGWREGYNRASTRKCSVGNNLESCPRLAYLDPRDLHPRPWTQAAVSPFRRAHTDYTLYITQVSPLSTIYMSIFQSITFIFSAASDAATTSHTTRTPNGPTNGPPHSQSSTDDGPGEPIYFYDSDKPYYESENLLLLPILGSFIPFRQVHQLFRPPSGIPWPLLPNC